MACSLVALLVGIPRDPALTKLALLLPLEVILLSAVHTGGTEL